MGSVETLAAPVASGSLWTEDPGINVDAASIDPSLPPPPKNKVRGLLLRAARAEGAVWESVDHSIGRQVINLRKQACYHRATALSEHLGFDDLGGFCIGWTSPVVAKAVLGDGYNFMGPPRTGGSPVAIAIGAGDTADEARRMAADLGHGRLVRTSAEMHEGPPALIDLVTRLLPLTGGVVDVHRVLVDVREGAEVHHG